MQTIYTVLIYVVMASAFCNAAPAQTNLPPVAPATNIDQKLIQADLVVVGNFLAKVNDRKAKSPIQILKVLKGSSASGLTNIYACFRAGALTVAPPKEAKWIFFLGKPSETIAGIEFRKTVGKYTEYDDLLNDDFEGILPATSENIKEVKRILTPSHIDKDSLKKN